MLRMKELLIIGTPNSSLWLFKYSFSAREKELATSFQIIFMFFKLYYIAFYFPLKIYSSQMYGLSNKVCINKLALYKHILPILLLKYHIYFKQVTKNLVLPNYVRISPTLLLA